MEQGCVAWEEGKWRGESELRNDGCLPPPPLLYQSLDIISLFIKRGVLYFRCSGLERDQSNYPSL